MITYQEWMRRTRSSAMRPRSGALRLLDSALRVHTSLRSKESFKGLKSAFESWQRTKNEWDSSIRNVDGAVTELAADIGKGWPPPPAAPPNPPVLRATGGVGGDARAAAAAEAKRRLLLAETEEFIFKRDVTQTLTYRRGDYYNHWTGSAWEERQYATPTNKSFAWTVMLGYLNRGPVIEVRVRLSLRMKDGTPLSPKVKNDFRIAFTGFWNCASIQDDVAQSGSSSTYKRTRDILFSIKFKDGPDSYVVDLANPPPVPSGLSRKERARHDDQNTIHMTEWCWADRAAVLHEFGHLIGCPDEYTTTSFTGMPLTWSAEIYDQLAYTTENIMNKPTEKAFVSERNFAMVLEGYKAWQRHLGADPSGASIVIRRARLPDVDLTAEEAIIARQLEIAGRPPG